MSYNRHDMDQPRFDGRPDSRPDRRGPPRPRNEFDLRPLEVYVDGDSVERAIKVLKRKIAEEGILRELKRRRYFEKPSERKKRKDREALRRKRKSERRVFRPA